MSRSFVANSPSRQDRANDRQQSARLIWRKALHCGHLLGVCESLPFSPAIFCMSVPQAERRCSPAQPAAPTDVCDLESPHESHYVMESELEPRRQRSFTIGE